MREFSINFHQSKYGCSRSSGLDASAVRSLAMIDSWTTIVSLGQKIIYFKVNPDTFFNLNTSLMTAGNYSYSFTANLEAFNPVTSTFNFEIVDSAKGFN